jgi:tetratricopeptide (TPR) repeat protein
VLVGTDLAGLDLAAGSQLVLTLLGAGQTSDAQAVLRGLLAKNPEAAATLDLAARVAERQGRLEEAAEFATRALAAAGDLPLERLRATYRRIFDLRARLAESIVLPDPKAPQAARSPLDQALDIAARWRAEDPDNKEIDERCATLLFILGQPDEAVRHLDSIVERHAGEGEAYSAVAAILEREGRFTDADLRWQQAIAVEPTNPTWLLGRAHNLLANGDTATARALAQQVKDGKWQDRFFSAKYQAEELLTQLAAMKR